MKKLVLIAARPKKESKRGGTGVAIVRSYGDLLVLSLRFSYLCLARSICLSLADRVYADFSHRKANFVKNSFWNVRWIEMDWIWIGWDPDDAGDTELF